MTTETFQGRADRLERRCVVFAPPAPPTPSAAPLPRGAADSPRCAG